MTGSLLLGMSLALELAADRHPGAVLREGGDFPVVVGHDVLGEPRSTAELRGGATLVVIVTDRAAMGQARAWWNAADARLPQPVRRLSIASIGVPFFVSIELARREARKNLPPERWRDVLLDTRRILARALGLEPSAVPWVLVVDSSGRITAQVHAPVDSPEAARVWRGLGAVIEAARR